MANREPLSPKPMLVQIMPHDVKISPSNDVIREGLKSKSRSRRKQTTHLSAPGMLAPKIRNDLLPRLHLVDRAPKDLVIPARNVRTVDQAHVLQAVASISTLGFTVPVLIETPTPFSTASFAWKPPS